jgi:hypothetical protein
MLRLISPLQTIMSSKSNQRRRPHVGRAMELVNVIAQVVMEEDAYLVKVVVDQENR